jgi:esterase/lipase superfamily enzyme
MPGPSIRVRFATNRKRSQGSDLFGNDFVDADPRHYVTGSINVVRQSNLPDTGWAPDPSSLQIDPPSPVLTTAITDVSTPATGILDFMSDRMLAQATPGPSGYGLVLLHGFAATFVDSMRRAAQVASSYRAADVFCFSWPANGIVDIQHYGLDRVAAEKSGPAIADALAHLFASALAIPELSRPRLHLVAHSMGNWALRNALQAIAKGDASLLKQRVFEGALLMAADEDIDAPSDNTKLGPLLTLARRVAVYRADGDLALAVSGNFLNGVPRLGMWGPKDLATLPPTVTSIDCSDVASTQGDHGETHYRHQYYRLSPPVIRDVIQVIAGKAPDQIAGRLRDINNPADGRGWWIPFDAGAAQLAAVATGTLNA